jgi:hypothetical protein
VATKVVFQHPGGHCESSLDGAPAAVNDGASTNEDTPTGIAVLSNDTDHDSVADTLIVEQGWSQRPLARVMFVAPMLARVVGSARIISQESGILFCKSGILFVGLARAVG